MAVKLDDVFEIVYMTVALIMLLAITFTLDAHGMFKPIRPSRVKLPPFIAAIRPVNRRSSAAETQTAVASTLRDAGIVQPITSTRAASPLPESDGPTGSTPVSEQSETEAAKPGPGDMVAIHFGQVQGGERSAQTSSAGIVLASGPAATTDASCRAWQQKLQRCNGVDVEVISSEEDGLQIAHFPWHGWLSKFILRHRVSRRLGLYLEKELGPRKQLSPCFVEIMSPVDSYITMHAFISTELRNVRERYGIPHT